MKDFAQRIKIYINLIWVVQLFIHTSVFMGLWGTDVNSSDKQENMIIIHVTRVPSVNLIAVRLVNRC